MNHPHLPPGDLGRVDDRVLIAHVAGGDRSAFEQLYRRHASWLTTRLQSRCGDPDLTDLAVQDTFVAVWRSASTFRADGDVGAWIWGIGIRRLIDLLRRRRTVPLDPAFVASLTATGLDRSVSTTDPEAAAIAGATAADVDGLHAAITALPDELRSVLVATAIDGLSTREAAVLLGIPRGTVKTRAMRARRQLQEALS